MYGQIKVTRVFFYGERYIFLMQNAKQMQNAKHLNIRPLTFATLQISVNVRMSMSS